MSFTYHITLVLTALAGGIAGLFLGGRLGKNIKLLLSFSGAYLLALSVLHIFPEIYGAHDSTIGLFVLFGFILQILLDYLSKGIEHGHIHLEDQKQSHFPYSIFISLCLHSLVEGMPLSGGHHHLQHNHGSMQDGLLIGIIVHKIPEAIALTTLLYFHYKHKIKTLIAIVIYGVMTPIGIWAGSALYSLNVEDPERLYDRLLAVVVGIFLHVSTTILFESSENHHLNIRKLIAVILGFALVYFATS